MLNDQDLVDDVVRRLAEGIAALRREQARVGLAWELRRTGKAYRDEREFRAELGQALIDAKQLYLDSVSRYGEWINGNAIAEREVGVDG